MAAVLKRGKSVRVSVNSSKTHPKSVHKKPNGAVCRSLHAEEAALRQARPGDTLYVIRFRADGSAAMAKPCPECQRALRGARVRKVFYTNDLGQWERLCLNGS